jgi:hypothetical protein
MLITEQVGRQITYTTRNRPRFGDTSAKHVYPIIHAFAGHVVREPAHDRFGNVEAIDFISPASEVQRITTCAAADIYGDHPFEAQRV